MEQKIKIFLDKIKKAKNIAIVGHKNPDGDSLCSVLALYGLIKQNFGKEAVCLYDGNIPDCLDFVPYRKQIEFFEHFNMAKKFDLVFIMDYGTVVHIGGPLAVVNNAGYKIEIDHHKNDNRIGDLCFGDEKSSSSGQILYSIAKKAKLSFDKDVASLFAVSILTDTGFFKYVRTGNEFRIMADLVKRGVSIEDIEDGLGNKPWKTIKTESAAAANAEFFYGKKLVVATISAADYKNLDGRGETVLNLLRQIKGVEFIVLLKEQKKGKIGLSFRSRKKEVLHIAARFGGGGHPRAAGAVVSGSLQEIKQDVIDAFKGE